MPTLRDRHRKAAAKKRQTRVAYFESPGSELRPTKVPNNSSQPKKAEKPTFLARLTIAFAGALGGFLVKLLLLSAKHHAHPAPVVRVPAAEYSTVASGHAPLPAAYSGTRSYDFDKELSQRDHSP
jgi:hypothetical protein